MPQVIATKFTIGFWACLIMANIKGGWWFFVYFAVAIAFLWMDTQIKITLMKSDERKEEHKAESEPPVNS